VKALRDGIQRVSDEAAGLLELQVIRRTDLPTLILDALAGSSEAAQTLRLVNDTVASIQAAPRRKPMLCGACPRGLRRSVLRHHCPARLRRSKRGAGHGDLHQVRAGF